MPRTTAPALRRGLDILELFLESNRALRVPDMVERLELPRASVHELVSALADRGYLQAVGEPPNRFVLGVRAFQLGAAYEREMDLASLGRESAQQVAQQCGETVQIVIRDGRDVVYIAKVDSTHSVRLVSNYGGRLPVNCTAGGKMLLSTLDVKELGELFPDDESLGAMTANSVSTRRRLFAELAEIRDRGWAEEYCESNEDAACVAAPIHDRAGTCVAAMSISVPTLRWNDHTRVQYAGLVREGARAVSVRLGATVGQAVESRAATA
jgi:IclR family KDG regulon transcriptional repressor